MEEKEKMKEEFIKKIELDAIHFHSERQKAKLRQDYQMSRINAFLFSYCCQLLGVINKTNEDIESERIHKILGE